MTENELQTLIVGYLRFAGVPNHTFFHTPNEGRVSRNAAAKRQAQGVNAGVPDLIFTLPTASALELKVGKGTPSKEQKLWISSAECGGMRCAITSGMHATILQLIAWGVLPVGGSKGGPLSPHMLALKAHDRGAWPIGTRPRPYLIEAHAHVAERRSVALVWSAARRREHTAVLAPLPFGVPS